MEEFGKKALTTLRTLASGDKYRLEKDEFDLDLTYVTHRVIAMGFPADKLVEQAYRNHIDEVADFFECHHSNHYMIFNLTEKHYDPGKFRNRVRFYGWPDHHPPPMSLLHDVVKAVHEWLEEDRLNVAAIHCKAGLGRTGTVISSYFLYAGFITAPEESMEFFGASRSQSARGVKVPSQRRCVNYLHQILTQTKSLDVVHRPKRLVLKRIEMMPVPDVDMIKGGFWPVVELVDMHRFHSPFFLKKAHRMYSGRKGDSSIVMDLNVPIAGDVLIRVYHFQDLLIGKSYPRLIFRYGFHTSFVEENRLMIPMTELDGAGHGQFSSDSFPSNFVLLNTFAEATPQPQPDLEVGAQGGMAARRMPLSPPHRLLIPGAASPYSSGGKPSEAEAEAEDSGSDEEERELKAALRMARLEDDRHRKEEKRRSRQAINLNRRSQQQQQQLPPPPWDASFCSPMPHRPLLLHRPSGPAPSAQQQNPPHQQPRELPHMVPLSQQRPQPVNHQPPPAAAAYNPFHGPHQAQAPSHQPQHQPLRPSDAAQSRADGQASALHPFFDQLLPAPAPGGGSSATAAGSGAAARPQPIRIACQSPRRRTPSPSPSPVDSLAQLMAPSPAPTLPPPAHSPAAAPPPLQQPMGATPPPQQQPPLSQFFAPPQMNQHPHPHPPHHQNHPPAPAHDLLRFPSSPHLVSLNFPSPGAERRQGQDAQQQQQRYLNELIAPVPPPAWDHPPHAVSVWAQRQMEEQREWRRLSGGPEPPYHRLQVPCALPSPSPLAATPPHFQPVAFPAGAQPPVFAAAATPTGPARGPHHHHHHQQPQLLSPSAYLPSSSPGVSLHHHHHSLG
ncbi:Protein-tyrosine-phosphatase [Acanthamoeba castellanii str. Neff]|uniref:Protein-tyrosine-phosphatase n=1 Tax=Acanthamoeba castellanii (strain ATCC 30010 / Neff) TaxID=1257118 RepID=L8GQ42_ACACF|nr:Protein-tyrosine-phosphatase [Acanthamoeba castellanii str. Neff]ELR15027.1 Protein-tyrosine-phosphatase [Acanthamoeba castellanii str. Neff]